MIYFSMKFTKVSKVTLYENLQSKPVKNSRKAPSQPDVHAYISMASLNFFYPHSEIVWENKEKSMNDWLYSKNDKVKLMLNKERLGVRAIECARRLVI